MSDQPNILQPETPRERSIIVVRAPCGCPIEWVYQYPEARYGTWLIHKGLDYQAKGYTLQPDNEKSVNALETDPQQYCDTHREAFIAFQTEQQAKKKPQQRSFW